MLHSILSKLPKPLDLEGLISRTVELFKKYPPSRLPGRSWARVSSNSVLKTTQNFQKLTQQSLEDGERYFKQEAAEIRRKDALLLRQRQLNALVRRYRRPATWMGGAIFVALMAFYLRSPTVPSSLLSWSSMWPSLHDRILEYWQRLH